MVVTGSSLQRMSGFGRPLLRVVGGRGSGIGAEKGTRGEVEGRGRGAAARKEREK